VKDKQTKRDPVTGKKLTLCLGCGVELSWKELQMADYCFVCLRKLDEKWERERKVIFPRES
jgi:hypothetical protein